MFPPREYVVLFILHLQNAFHCVFMVLCECCRAAVIHCSSVQLCMTWIALVLCVTVGSAGRCYAVCVTVSVVLRAAPSDQCVSAVQGTAHRLWN